MAGKITFESTGSFKNTETFLQRMSKRNISAILEKYGALGVEALRAATPVDTSLTSQSWTYKVSRKGPDWELSWHNQNGSSGAPIAILLQYGHGTGTGGYVAGEDYINPAIRPIFDQIAAEAWREVTRK